MTIRTATGRELECDSLVSIETPPRLYLIFAHMSLADVASIFANHAELPVDGYEAFDAFQNMSVAPDGIRVTLKKEGT